MSENARQTASAAQLPAPILDKVIQVCMVTDDHEAMMASFVNLGIGPWQVLTLSPPRISGALYYGKPHTFTLIRCLAFVDNFVWEIIEPVAGTSIFHDFLAARGPGVHHLGMTHRTDDFDGCVAAFNARGYKTAQFGLWDDQLRFAFMATDDAIGTFIEIWDKPAGFKEPAPELWYP